MPARAHETSLGFRSFVRADVPRSGKPRLKARRPAGARGGGNRIVHSAAAVAEAVGGTAVMLGSLLLQVFGILAGIVLPVAVLLLAIVAFAGLLQGVTLLLKG